MLCRTGVLSAASTPSLAPYLVIWGPSSWALLTALVGVGFQTSKIQYPAHHAEKKPMREFGFFFLIPALRLQVAHHVSGHYPFVKLLAGHVAAGYCGFAQAGAFLVGLFGDVGGLVVADVGVESCDQHQ